jgi:hypothetical protein
MFAPPALLIQSWLELTGKLLELQQQTLLEIVGAVSPSRGRRTF